MAKVKIDILQKPVRGDGTVNIKLRINHKTWVRFIGTDYYVKPKDFPKKIPQETINKLQVLSGEIADKISKIADIKSIL